MRYRYEDFPNLSKRIVDLANTDIVEYHRGHGCVHNEFVISFFNAVSVVELEILKKEDPQANRLRWPVPTDRYPKRRSVIGFVPN